MFCFTSLFQIYTTNSYGIGSKVSGVFLLVRTKCASRGAVGCNKSVKNNIVIYLTEVHKAFSFLRFMVYRCVFTRAILAR